MGALVKGPVPPEGQWASGHLEFSRSMAEGGARRLILRASHASPDKGVIYELYQPCLVDVRAEGYLRIRGIEPFEMSDAKAAMVQEWLVKPLS